MSLSQPLLPVPSRSPSSSPPSSTSKSYYLPPWDYWSRSPPWTLSIEAVAAALGVDDVLNGVSEYAVITRRAVCGDNTFPSPPSLSFWHVFVEEIKEPLIVLLLIVGVLYFVWGQVEEALTVLAIIMICIGIEMYTEYKAKKALAALQSSQFHPPVRVVRDGSVVSVEKEQVVVGDILLLSTGDRVVADGRVVSSTWLTVDESALTGEADSRHKSADEILPPQTSASALHKHINMIYADTLITQGEGRIIITATGVHCVSGKMRETISQQKGKKRKTPMQKMMKKLAFQLTVAAALVCACVLGFGFLSHLPYDTVILSTLSLAFATIPEELPILIKVVVALGAMKMSKQHILVKSLKTAENLGGISVILTDKTGTITQNKLTLEEWHMQGKQTHTDTQRESKSCIPLLNAWLLSSPTLLQHMQQQQSNPDEIKDRLDRAVIAACQGQTETDSKHISIDAETPDGPAQQTVVLPSVAAALQSLPPSLSSSPKQLLPFDNWRKRSSCVWISSLNAESQCFLYCRGSPESVLSVCSSVMHLSGDVTPLTDSQRSELLAYVDALTKEAIRVLAFACRSVVDDRQLLSDSTDSSASVLESDLTFVGFLSFCDRLRTGVKSTITQLIKAGITVKMVTGDHVNTATAIAKHVGIINNTEQVTELHTDNPTQRRNNNEQHTQEQTEENKTTVTDTLQFTCYARQTPDDKHNLVLWHQQQQQRVLVTGDGFNDSPALSVADVGMAMGGESSTDIARESAGLIIVNDDFNCVFSSILQGRIIMDNLKKAIRFYLACKLTLSLLFAITLLTLQYTPMLPFHVIVLECFMDLGASTAFTTEKADNTIMTDSPSVYQADKLLTGRGFFPTIVAAALVMEFVVYGVCDSVGHAVELHTEWSVDERQSVVQSVTFVCWLISHVLLAQSMRSLHRSVLVDSFLSYFKGTGAASSSSLTLFSNPLLLVWTVTTFLFCVLICSIPFLRQLFEIHNLFVWLSFGKAQLPAYVVPFLVPLVVFVTAELGKFFYSRSKLSFALFCCCAFAVLWIIIASN